MFKLSSPLISVKRRVHTRVTYCRGKWRIWNGQWGTQIRRYFLSFRSLSKLIDLPLPIGGESAFSDIPNGVARTSLLNVGDSFQLGFYYFREYRWVEFKLLLFSKVLIFYNEF